MVTLPGGLLGSTSTCSARSSPQAQRSVASWAELEQAHVTVLSTPISNPWNQKRTVAEQSSVAPS